MASDTVERSSNYCAETVSRVLAQRNELGLTQVEVVRLNMGFPGVRSVREWEREHEATGQVQRRGNKGYKHSDRLLDARAAELLLALVHNDAFAGSRLWQLGDAMTALTGRHWSVRTMSASMKELGYSRVAITTIAYEFSTDKVLAYQRRILLCGYRVWQYIFIDEVATVSPVFGLVACLGSWGLECCEGACQLSLGPGLICTRS